MIGMQYKIILPRDYDMGTIRKRVEENGHKTDGFPGLNFKAYLITEKRANGNLYNCYAPLYTWNNAEGMNKFIFDGFYDNILGSFGWQHIHIGVPFSMELGTDFHKSKFAIEYAGTIPESKSLLHTPIHSIHADAKNAGRSLGNVILYNPDKWGYSQFSFYEEKPKIEAAEHFTIYEILHISQ